MRPASRRTATLVAALLPLTLVASPAFASATANEVVYVADHDNDGNYDLVIRDLESRRVTTVARSSDADPVTYDDPELSPNGTRIAVSTDRGSTDFESGIAVLNRDGTGFRRLTTPPQDEQNGVYSVDLAPSWSPDGSTILFSRLVLTEVPDGTPRLSSALYTVPAAGGTTTAVSGGEGGYTADWSPDGTRIVFAALPANADIDTTDPGTLTVLERSSGARTSLNHKGALPDWSPDGTSIAYAKILSTDETNGDTAVIATVNPDGTNQRDLMATKPTSSPSVAEYPSWTPDSEAIVFDLYRFASGRETAGDLWAVDRSGLRAGQVTQTAGDETQGSVHGPAPQPVQSAGSASTFTATTPKRLLDTREGIGAPVGKVGPGGTVQLQIRSVGTATGNLPANASAVVLNVTVTGTTANTDVRVYPTGAAVPGASNLNAAAGQSVPNLVTSAIGSDGTVTLRNSGGTVHLIADIAGWYAPDATGSGFASLDPGRILDTRFGVGAPAAKVGAGQFVDLDVTGTLTTQDGNTRTVPENATAVVLNVTATGASRTTDVRVYPTPADSSVPEVSNLNVRAGQTAPNLVTVAVGQGGTVRLRNAAGDVHLIADIAGYYSADAPGRFVPVVPVRFLDTRSGIGAAPTKVGPEQFVDVRIAGARGVPAGATGAVLNLTGTGPSASTDVRAYPTGAATVPTVSNLNLTRGLTRANLAIVKPGEQGRVRIRNAAGTVDLIGDLAGYFVNG